MKKEIFIIVIFIIFGWSVKVFGKDNSLPDEQTITNLNEDIGEENTAKESIIDEKSYQDQILSNPETNAGARVGIKQSGRNTAIINQEGRRNALTIIQSGNSNIAIQSRTGTDNDIYLKQTGNDNQHYETQTGNHNRKIIIQNDTETILEQAIP